MMGCDSCLKDLSRGGVIPSTGGDGEGNLLPPYWASSAGGLPAHDVSGVWSPAEVSHAWRGVCNCPPARRSDNACYVAQTSELQSIRLCNVTRYYRIRRSVDLLTLAARPWVGGWSLGRPQRAEPA